VFRVKNKRPPCPSFSKQQISVSRTTFNEWLEHPEMLKRFTMADSDMAEHADLFDVLVVDMGNNFGWGSSYM
jgi:hypothetical protein